MLAVGDLDAARNIDGLVERELDSFNQVEGNCVLQTAKIVILATVPRRKSAVLVLEAFGGLLR